MPPWLVLVDDSVAQLKRASDAFARHHMRGTLVQLDRRNQLPAHLGSFAGHELKSLTLARTHFGSLAWTYSNLLEFARAFEQHLAIHDASWRTT